jgi:hypothetical protein
MPRYKPVLPTNSSTNICATDLFFSRIAEHGEAVSVMRAIKKAIDPDNIMNPGKVFRLLQPESLTDLKGRRDSG